MRVQSVGGLPKRIKQHPHTKLDPGDRRLIIGKRRCPKCEEMADESGKGARKMRGERVEIVKYIKVNREEYSQKS